MSDERDDPIGVLAADVETPDDVALYTSALCIITAGDVRSERAEKLELAEHLRRTAMNEHLMAQRAALAERDLVKMAATQTIKENRAGAAPTEVEGSFIDEQGEVVRFLIQRLVDTCKVQIIMVAPRSTKQHTITETGRAASIRPCMNSTHRCSKLMDEMMLRTIQR